MPYRYEYTRLLVTNFAACFRFYRDVLGLPVSFGAEHDTYASFSTGDVNLSLFDRQEMSAALGTTDLPPTASAQDTICLVFAVADVDAACARLQALGITPAVPPTDHPDWGIRTAHLRDPDGNLIEINQPL